MEFLRYGPTSDAAIKYLVAERDKAQSNCSAWLNVFETIEAHLKDRIAMKDEANPERYLEIIRYYVEDVSNEAKAYTNARSEDWRRYQTTIDRLNLSIAELLAATKFLVVYAGVQVRLHPEARDTPDWQRLLAAIAKAEGQP